MFFIFINLILFCCIEINGKNIEFNVEPHTSCGEPFCETFHNYPNESISKLVIGHPSFVQRIQDIEFELNLKESKARKRSLCDCRSQTLKPLVGLNVYNTPRFIVNIDEQYEQKFKSCSLNLTNEEEFKKTPCAYIRPIDDAHKPMCLPKYQNVILNVIKGEQLYLDEFYVIPMYTCVFVQK